MVEWNEIELMLTADCTSSVDDPFNNGIRRHTEVAFIPSFDGYYLCALGSWVKKAVSRRVGVPRDCYIGWIHACEKPGGKNDMYVHRMEVGMYEDVKGLGG